ncbi:MAG: hypothetical protein KF819_21885 [Labilithrix sp.]|nr:hypothetical protein [Labilithrix sp.]
MYREDRGERRARVEERRREAVDAARRALDARYGLSARGAVTESVTALEAIVLDESFDALERTEAAIEALEQAVEAFVDAAEKQARHAAAFAPVGDVSTDAAIYAEPFTRFLYAGIPSAVRKSEVAAALREVAARWVKQMPELPLVDPIPDGMALFFHSDARPFRLDLIARFDGESTTVSSALIGEAKPVAIAVRPQTMGDDLLATFGFRKDMTFDDDLFDATYFVAGEDRALRAFFTPEVRSAFCRIANEQPPTVTVRDGLATLELTHQRLATACALLAALR